MNATTMSQDAQDFLAYVLFLYPDEDAGESLRDKTVYDFSPEFVAGVEKFLAEFRCYLEERGVEIPDSERSFGGNCYVSLSGHGIGFWDDQESEHLQEHLIAYSGDAHRFEHCMDLYVDEVTGKIDLSFLPEVIADYRDKLFSTPTN